MHDYLKTHLFAIIAYQTLAKGETIKGFELAHMYTLILTKVEGSTRAQFTYAPTLAKP